MQLTSGEISSVTGGKLTGKPDLKVADILTDSRRYSFDPDFAFFAISGKNHDGHAFIESLHSKGIRTFIVERIPENTDKYDDSAFILVEDTVDALQKIARYQREKYRSTVIAVTGSTGKTIVKEWLSDILGIETTVIRSPRSYNSQIGVPLSVFKLDARYKMAIFEAGISFPGEMDKLQRVIEPDIGVITNIGDAHSENFPDLTTKASEKLKLFLSSSLIVYCRDYAVIHETLVNDKLFRGKRLIDWSLKDREASVFFEKNNPDEGCTDMTVHYMKNTYDFRIPFDDRASVENAMTVTAVCLALNAGIETIREGLRGLQPVAMRMNMKAGINDCRLIEDYYNSDPGSLGAAIEYLKNEVKLKRTLILSDFIQSGRDKKELYGEVADMLKKNGIEKFIGIGPALSENASLFEGKTGFYYSTDEFVSSFRPSMFNNEIILLKGARIYEFERIARLLEQKVHQTTLEINLDAIEHNLNEFRRSIPPSTRIMAMVKAFAYGSGSSEIAGLLEYQRVSYLAVAYTDEGLELRNTGVTLPVMIMNPDPSSLEQLIRYDLEPEIYSFDSFDKFTETASRHGLIGYPVHIKTDTGMHRLGFMPQDIDRLTARIRESESIKVVTVLSHFAASEMPEYDDFTHRQAEIFMNMAQKISDAAGYPVTRHICNSSAIVRFPQYHFEMVRPGIGLYGAGGIKGLNLKAAGRFRTRISQIKAVPAFEPVGYGCRDISDRERIIAILPVGYADGLNRKLGNGRGSMFIKGRRVTLTGNICMDMCMADITGIDAAEGDEAEIFGENITIDELAEKCETIPYEIITSIPPRVNRIFYRE